MNRTWALLISTVLILSIGMGAIEATGSKGHRHTLAVTYRSAQTAIGSDDVQYVTARCPAGYRAIAASGDTDTIAYSNGYELTRTDATAWWINHASGGGTVRVKVTCLKGKTSKVRASSVKSHRQQLERKRALLAATLR